VSATTRAVEFTREGFYSPHLCRAGLRTLVDGPTFLMLTGLLILLNIVCICFETDYTAAHGGTTELFLVFEMVFNFFFMLELTRVLLPQRRLVVELHGSISGHHLCRRGI